MGAAPSNIDAPLVAQASPIVAIDERFCAPTATKLHIQEHVSFSGRDSTIFDVATSQVVFRTDGRAISWSNRTILLDASDKPVAHMSDRHMTWRPIFRVCVGPAWDTQLFQIETKAYHHRTELQIRFRDVQTKTVCNLFVFGDWRARAAVICLDRGNGVNQRIARAFRPVATARNIVLNKQDYYIEIAPNVDSALIVLACIAMDAAHNKAKSHRHNYMH